MRTMRPYEKSVALAAVAMLVGFGLCETTMRLLAPRGTPLKDKQAAVEAKLELAWKLHHPNAPLPPPCERDAVQELYGEMDPHQGREMLLASSRLGIAMFAESGDLLAFRDRSRCGGGRWWIAYRHELVLHEVQPSVDRCRASRWVTHLQRQYDVLVPVERRQEADLIRCTR